MMKKLFLLMGLSFFWMTAPVEAAPLKVVASFSILGDMVKNVGGDAVEVTALVGPDRDVHSFQPTPEDAKAVAEADLIFVNGLGFEGWMQRLVEASGTKAKVIIASQGVKSRMMFEDGKTITDPHAWQSVMNGRIYVQNIMAALRKEAPDEAVAIKARALAYDTELSEVDRFLRAEFSKVPKVKRKIITSHSAFGYFGAEYKIMFFAPQGRSTEAEPSPMDVAKLIQQIKDLGVKQVFIENMANPKLIEQIGKDTGAVMGGTLYSDALSVADGPASTYLAMFKSNAPKLKAAMMSNVN